MKNKLPVGYKAHFARLKEVQQSVDVVRTHKYKLILPEDTADLEQKIEVATSMVEGSQEGSILWFLLQLYGMGFLFIPSKGGRPQLLQALYPEKDFPEVDRIIDVVHSDWKIGVKDKNSLYKLLITGKRELQKKIKENPNNICLNGIKDAFLEDFAESIDNKFKVLLRRQSDDFKINPPQIQAFFASKGENFDLESVSEVESGLGDSKKGYEPTFVIQKLESLSILKENIENDIDIYQAYFDYIVPASQQTGYDIQDLFGCDKTINGLSSTFNYVLNAFQTDREETSHYVLAANPFLGSDPEYLNVLVDGIMDKAKKLKSKEDDFLSQDWSQYRALVGGRLKSWLSNFENRLDLYKKYFSPKLPNKEGELEENKKCHQVIYKLIYDNCDYKKFFPKVQVENFEQLIDIASKCKDALNSRHGLGSILDKYLTYLRPFREYLIKLNNEGIRVEISTNGQHYKIVEKEPNENEIYIDKKLLTKPKKNSETDDLNENFIYGFWGNTYIPGDLEKYPRFIGEAQRIPQKVIEQSRRDLFNYSAKGMTLISDIVRKNRNELGLEEFNTYIWASTHKWNTSNLIWEKKGKTSELGAYHRSLETLRRIALRYSREIANRIIDFICQITGESFSEDFLQEKYYVSGYEYRNKSYKKNIKIVSYDNFVNIFQSYFGIPQSEDLSDWNAFYRFNTKGIATEESSFYGEILKVYFGFLLKPLAFKDLKLVVNLTHPCCETFRENVLFTLINKQGVNVEVPKRTVERFIAAGVGSTIRGALSTLSRDSFIERTTLQVSNGGQSTLSYVALEWGEHLMYEKSSDELKRMTKAQRRRYKIGVKKLNSSPVKGFSKKSLEVLDKLGWINYNNREIVNEIFRDKKKNKKEYLRVLAEIPHRWEMVLKTKSPIVGFSSKNEFFAFEKSQGKNQRVNMSLKKVQKGTYFYPFPIETSTVQKQFLEKFLWGDKQGILDISLQGSSIIFEKHIEIFNQESTRFNVIDKKMYYAVPFKIEMNTVYGIKNRRELGNYELKNFEDKSQKQYREEENLMGIDLGEYGFGWAIFDPNDKTFTKSGFEEVPLLKKMRDEAAAWKDTQSRGIFSTPTTYLADIREKAAGAVRNKIHALAIQYHAIPIYEDSVDGFESGGQRISKLYKTLKTSDVIGGNSNDADKAVRKHFWGIDFASIGGVVGSSMTSQTCRCCGKSAVYDTRLRKNENQPIEVLNGTFTINNNIISLGEDINGTYSGQQINDLIQLMKSKQRVESEHEQENRATGKVLRGRVGEFRCLYCNNTTDADQQAAMNIALKYFLKISASEEQKAEHQNEKGILSTLSLFIHESRNRAVQLAEEQRDPDTSIIKINE